MGASADEISPSQQGLAGGEGNNCGEIGTEEEVEGELRRNREMAEASRNGGGATLEFLSWEGTFVVVAGSPFVVGGAEGARGAPAPTVCGESTFGGL